MPERKWKVLTRVPSTAIIWRTQWQKLPRAAVEIRGFATMIICQNLHTCARHCHCHFISCHFSICAGEKASDAWIHFVIPGGRWFWSLLISLEMAFALNLEMPDCWPMLSKSAWFQKGNTAFCSSRQHPSSSINQSAGCLGTQTVTHADGGFSVTIVLTLGRQREALYEKAVTGNACPWQHGFAGGSDTVSFLQSRAVRLSCWDPE